jgi:hypothetical protein
MGLLIEQKHRARVPCMPTEEEDMPRKAKCSTVENLRKVPELKVPGDTQIEVRHRWKQEVFVRNTSASGPYSLCAQ